MALLSLRVVVAGNGQPGAFRERTRRGFQPRLSDGEEIAAAHGEARLHRVAGAGHTFGAAHPWQGTTPALESALGALIEFFATTLQ